MYAVSPLAYPLALLLDWLLGAESEGSSGAQYGREELRVLVELSAGSGEILKRLAI